MEITIENLSSPGAHFSKNTNNVLLNIYKWIHENNTPTLKFIEFRKKTAMDKNFNDNNARNIYPLLKNCGFIEYQSGGMLCTEKFFTNRGRAYVKVLETIELLKDASEYTEKQKKNAIEKFEEVLSNLIDESLDQLLKVPELNYTSGLKWFLNYILKFGKINKTEFAYLVYQMEESPDDWYEKMKDNITRYRNKELKIEVKVKVRNDVKLKEQSGKGSRIEDISFFTAYSFYSGLLSQAGLIQKEHDYFYIQQGMENRVKNLLLEE